MVSLSSHQLSIVTAPARTLPTEKRHAFMQRVNAQLRAVTRFSDDDVAAAAETALRTLIVTAA